MVSDVVSFGETMLRLNATKLYQAVDLHYTQSGKVGERETVEFELALQLQPLAPAALEGTSHEVVQAKAQ